MPKLPLISGKNMRKLLEKEGFEVIRSKGSHFVMQHPALRKKTVVPIHGNEGLRPGIILSILDQSGISKDDYCRKI